MSISTLLSAQSPPSDQWAREKYSCVPHFSHAANVKIYTQKAGNYFWIGRVESWNEQKDREDITQMLSSDGLGLSFVLGCKREKCRWSLSRKYGEIFSFSLQAQSIYTINSKRRDDEDHAGCARFTYKWLKIKLTMEEASYWIIHQMHEELDNFFSILITILFNSVID